MNLEFEKEWLQVLAKYSLIKEIYILCEETDPELKTNLQPLNEFRAALDHIMKLNNARYNSGDEEECKKQFEKLNSHLDRAFFDICDMVSINIRNMIIDRLEGYDSTVISEAIPDYYNTMRPNIDEIRGRIVNYRNNKGSFDSITLYESYKGDIDRLLEIQKEITRRESSLQELQKKVKKEKEKTNRPILIGIIISVVGIIIGAIIGILF